MEDAISEVTKFIAWNHQKEIVKEDKHLTVEEKTKIINAIEYLHRILGNDFLEKAAKNRHPIISYLTDTAPWTRYWLLELANMFTAFEKTVCFDRVFTKIRSPECFLSAMQELDIAYRMNKHDYLIGFYPKVNTKRECDFQAQKENKITFFEVSGIEASRETNKARRTFEQIAWAQHNNHEVETAGRLYKALSMPRIQELKKRISRCIEKALAEQEAIAFSEPAIIDFIVAPRVLSDRVIKWRNENGLKDSSWTMPMDSPDEIGRIRKTFQDENRQLPKDAAGVIVLFDRNIYGRSSPDFYSGLTYALEEEIYEHSNLVAGVIIFPDSVGVAPAGCYSKNVTWSRTARFGLFGENTLVIRNKYSKFSIDEDIVRSLIT